MGMSVNFLKALQDIDLEKNITKNDFSFNANGDVHLITSTLSGTYPAKVITTEIFYLVSGDVDKIETTYDNVKTIETFRYNALSDIIGSDITKVTLS